MCTIPPHYDSMIGKLIVHAPDRDGAIAKMRGALEEFRVAPVKTTIALHRRLMDERAFVEAQYDVRYLERLLKNEPESMGEAGPVAGPTRSEKT